MTNSRESTTRFLVDSTAQAALTGAWTAAAEFPVAKRRAVRTGLLGTAVVIAAAARDRSGAATDEPTMAAPQVPDGGAPGAPTAGPAGPAAAIATGAVAAVAVYVGGRQLEKRWLARLIRDGHAHPHLALGVRMAALSVLMSASARILSAQTASRWAARQPGAPGSDVTARDGA